ncbi:MAG: N-acetyl-gamma-glutamyl-phosphate reductase [Myxococcales bacterium]
MRAAYSSHNYAATMSGAHPSDLPAIGIIGASGYAGMEATRILAHHPGVELRMVASDRWQDEPVERRLGALGRAGALRYEPLERALHLAGGCAAVLLATPAEASVTLAPQLLARGVRVIDLSGAYRLRDRASFDAAYKIEHKSFALLAEAVYGLPELLPDARRVLGAARLVANPGCYATAAALALAPLVAEGLLAEEPLVIDAASGTSGAGRKASEDFSFSELEGDFRAYRVLRHQHTPEIAQTLAASRAGAGSPVPLTFTPHLLPLRRGILATCYGHLARGRKPAELREALLHKYAGSRFVDVAASPDEVRLANVVGTNRCQVAVACGGEPYDPGRVVVIAAIDNLVKGASGQAVQNLNLCLGLDEAEGLATLRGAFP